MCLVILEVEDLRVGEAGGRGGGSIVRETESPGSADGRSETVGGMVESEIDRRGLKDGERKGCLGQTVEGFPTTYTGTVPLTLPPPRPLCQGGQDSNPY